MNSPLPMKYRRIILNGGDAPLHPEFPDICRYVRDICGSVVFSSNGILISDVIHLLRSSDAVQISIDGDRKTHDSIRGSGVYDAAVNALYLLKQHQITHSLSCTIHRENVHCLDHIIDLAIRTGSALLNIGNYSPIIPCGLEPLRYNEWLSLKNKARELLAPHRIQVPVGCTETGCIGGILGLSVLPDGTYWDCSRNQNVIGSYPQKIVDVLDWNRIADGCMKTVRNVFYGE